MKNKVLKVHPSDNLIVALQTLEKFEEVVLDGEEYILPNAIEAKHKFVIHDLHIGDTVTMYGVRVGKAIQKIKRGEQITTFNLKHESAEFSVKN
jgi:altronate hydrolase